MKKKLFAFCCSVMLLVSSIAVVPAKAVLAATTPKPMIGTWHYQTETPLVGKAYQYNTYQGDTSINYALENKVLSIGLNGLFTAFQTKVPDTAIAKFMSTVIFSTISQNVSLDTPILYCVEKTWDMDDSSSLNYEVLQNWYSDSAHSKYIATTIYYASFY